MKEIDARTAEMVNILAPKPQVLYMLDGGDLVLCEPLVFPKVVTVYNIVNGKDEESYLLFEDQQEYLNWMAEEYGDGWEIV